MSKEDIFKKCAQNLRKYLSSLTKEEKEALKERLTDKRPKGWINIDESLPMMYIKDMAQGYSTFKVKDKDGNEFETNVTDHHIWFYKAKDIGITHWLNE